ncbi:MAG: thiopeptide-type bacteriocin biosynthesis protein [Pseudonocardiaceae bacterium]
MSRLDGRPHEWVALHAFYASDANPMIVDAVRPLVAELRRDQLINRWFFIKYWQEGPHVRVRLRPSCPELQDEVTARAIGALETFLQQRPALYDTSIDGTDDMYKKMYIAEYGEEKWAQEYGVDGRMPLRPNNSVAVMRYEPEYDRYGGPVGMDIAECHFERSSDFVAKLLTTSNPHVRPVLLGLAAQLSLMTVYTFLRDDAAVRRFFERYRRFWETSYQEPSDGYHSSFDKSYAVTKATLCERINRIRDLVTGDRGQAVSQMEQTWLIQARELRERVLTAAQHGELSFPSADRHGQTMLEDPEALATVLLSSYIHMTNNRLGIAILDEIYLSYLVERALGPDAELAEPA